MGYAGGSTAFPTYKSIQDYTEAIRLGFDPKVISYERILELFFEMQGGPPMMKSFSRQYRSAILVHNDEQRGTVEKMLAAFEANGAKKVYTDVEEATDFYRAEEYHQEYVKKSGARRGF